MGRQGSRQSRHSRVGMLSLPNAKSLEVQIDNADVSSNAGDYDGFNVGQLITALDTALNQDNFFSKSRLTQKNIRGMLKGLSMVMYLEEVYDIHPKVLPSLIKHKMEISLSADGTGREEVIRAIKEGTLKVEAKTGFDATMERMFGGPPR